MNLYMLNACVIFFLLYFLGTMFSAAHIYLINFNNFLAAFFISCISANFIYSFNSVSDVEIDKVNKPNRPIPSGVITIKSASIYCFILAISSIIYPFFIFKSNLVILLALSLFLVGFLYSYKKTYLKRNKFLAIFSIAYCYFIVFLIGFLNNDHVFNKDFYILSLIIILFALAIIPIKDFSDKIGDKINNSDNWFNSFKQSNVFIFSNFLILINIVLLFFVESIFIKFIFIPISLSFVILFGIFIFLKMDFKNFYNILLKTISIVSILFFILFYIV